mmetsp:Transcript_10889/g.26727  ORF Transcript_10889/g.26727 Transcript_10889/m.26727 type:complete len:709 (+) Transcript_10889:417-2543(+)|eukprot:CAMPEP_0178985330 /NCGR_PEP_ID=MMETSP0795-20121207/2088_1 /TAXON_ID=88552 /ORGANISM="Amoebophrya sp., Strain Ameob2" /LENGTH=708 /DNA_ID=CAMNT_0020676267 /DNA_START=335 /DNA_END=2461 /DNA_ORIENTATION=-
MGLGLSKALVASIWSELAPPGWARPSAAERQTHFLGIYPTGDGVEEEAAVEGGDAENAEVAREAAAASTDWESPSQKFLAKRELSAEGSAVQRRPNMDETDGVTASGGAAADEGGLPEEEKPELPPAPSTAEASSTELDMKVEEFKHAAKCCAFARDTCNRIQKAVEASKTNKASYWKFWMPVDPFWKEIEQLAAAVKAGETHDSTQVGYLAEVEQCASDQSNPVSLPGVAKNIFTRVSAGKTVAEIVKQHMESIWRNNSLLRLFSYGVKKKAMDKIQAELPILCGKEDSGNAVEVEEVGKNSGQRWVTQADGVVYFGGWDTKTNTKNGKGMQFFPSDDAVYNGDWKLGKRSGEGKQEWGNGGVYTGQWESDEKAGGGTMTWDAEQSKGEDDAADAWKKRGTYTGEWKADKRHGQGSQDFGDDQHYNGHWEDDKPHGIGEMHWPGGTGNGGVATAGSQSSRMVMYKGPWIKGKPDTTTPSPIEGAADASPGETGSKGFAAYADGSEYDGGWKQGRRDGEGVLTTLLDEKPKSSAPFQCLVQQGTWEDDKMQARDSGQKEEVALKQRAGGDQAGRRGGRLESVGEHALREYTGGGNNEGQKDGTGIETEYDNNGNKLRTYDGKWVNGEKEGRGKEKTHPDTADWVEEVGHWKNGKKEGEFIRTYGDQAQTQNEVWLYKNGKVDHSVFTLAGGGLKRSALKFLGFMGVKR